MVRHVVEVANKRVPVIAGSGSNSTREAVELTQAARSAGADAALLISPYYNKPTQEGIYQHYCAVAREGGLPALPYNIPGRTASRLEPETIGRLSRVPGLVGLKESGGDLFATSYTIARCAPGFCVLSGDDALTLPMLAIGATGVISTTANAAPAAMVEITRAFRAGRLRARARLSLRAPAAHGGAVPRDEPDPAEDRSGAAGPHSQRDLAPAAHRDLQGEPRETRGRAGRAAARMTRVLIVGAAGRMGESLVRNVAASQDLKLGAALEHASHPRLGDELAPG